MFRIRPISDSTTLISGKPFRRGTTFCLIGLALLVGCDAKPPLDDAPRVPAATITGTGRVTGQVIFNGPTPPKRMLRNSPCCEGAPAEHPDESVVINANGTLANTFVYLEGGPRTDGSALPKQTLDQVYCRYVPHVIGVVVGQTLHIKSSDPTMHNVHYTPKYSPSQNFWMKAAGEGADTTFKAPEFVTTGCDIHPWMNAHIGVFDNPFFAITGENGTFEIAAVPAGTYTLVARHERYGRLEQKIEIGAEPVTHDFTYAPPK